MATNILIGDAATATQVSTVTPAGTIEATDIFTVTLTDELGNATMVSYTGSATANGVATGLQALMAAAKAGGDVPWSKVTAVDSTGFVTITATTAGVPFTLAVATTETGGGAADDQTISTTTTTACSGPKLYGVAENWSLRAVPAATNDVIIPATFTGTIYGYDASAVALNSFTIEPGCTATIGSRDKALQIDLADSKNYYLNGTGETWLAITGAGAAVNVGAAGRGSGTGTYGLNLITGEATQTVDVRCASTGERVSLAARAGHTGTFPTIKIGGGYVGVGAGVTSTSITWTGGDVHLGASITTVLQEGGRGYLEGACAIGTTLTVNGGTCYEMSTGLKAAVKIGGTGTVNCDASGLTRTWTATDIYEGGHFIDKQRTVTHATAPTNNQCGFDAIDKGKDFNWTVAAAS